ncbi:MAG: hypothetical protein FD174_2867 [Geobacteraceae bacterium]|nr:MAG: hypothetical protein FD174_2867 [Geobacteraceae bacterium]
MSFAKRQKQREGNPLARIYNLQKGFAMLPMEVINSPAYRDLLPSAAKCLPLFIFKFSNAVQSIGSNLMAFTYAEAQRLGLSKKGFSHAIKDLEAKGFIDIVEHGGLRGTHGTSSKYTLSSRFKDYTPGSSKPVPEDEGVPWKTSNEQDGSCQEAA